MSNNPLGKYSQIVAAIVAVATIFTALALNSVGHAVGYVDNLALFAFGAIFGASATTAATNGTLGRGIAALHARLDAAGIPADGAAAGPAT